MRKLEARIRRLIQDAAGGHAFLAVCMALSLAGTASAAFPVTAVVVPAALLLPRRWLQIAVVAALGSALGATLLVVAFHDLAWVQVYERFPELMTQATWAKVMAWVSNYGTIALFLVAASPLPQTPALIFFGVAQQDYAGVFVAMLAGKTLKYGLFAWLAARFPERFGDGIGGILGRLANGGRKSR